MSHVQLETIRSILKQKQIHAFILPATDPHKSEYISNYWKTREWLTGFSGSAGTAVITAKHAGLWTDSRYFIQAEQQLQLFTLHKIKTIDTEYLDWLTSELNMWDNVGIDSQLFSINEIETFKQKFALKQIKIVDIGDVFNSIWTNRPAISGNTIIEHDSKYTELTRNKKIDKLRSYMAENNSDNILISALDDSAWLLNIRGSENKYNPVFRAYTLVNRNSVFLFVDEANITNTIKTVLQKDNITILPYTEIESYLKDLPKHSNIEVDGNTFNYKLNNIISDQCTVKYENSIVGKFKAIKSNKEIEHYKNAQIRDGLAMCNFLYWLENNIKTQAITEIDAAKKAEQFRSEQENYMGLSFEVISAYMENAALPHYSPNKKNPVQLKPKGLYLIDCGSQYLDGTTDIARTVALGEVTSEQKANFTLVLKGHIRLDSITFPYGTKGFHLDTIARLDLWQQGKNYGHGTGHGLGYYLNVHEGPQGFSQSEKGSANTVIEPGMLISNEPGYYLQGQYGIRIENVLVCCRNTDVASDNFLRFETVSYCPIDKSLIDITMLSEFEIQWLNSYHKNVFNLISPFASTEVSEWLREKTSAIN